MNSLKENLFSFQVISQEESTLSEKVRMCKPEINTEGSKTRIILDPVDPNENLYVCRRCGHPIARVKHVIEYLPGKKETAAVFLCSRLVTTYIDLDAGSPLSKYTTQILCNNCKRLLSYRVIGVTDEIWGYTTKENVGILNLSKTKGIKAKVLYEIVMRNEQGDPVNRKRSNIK